MVGMENNLIGSASVDFTQMYGILDEVSSYKLKTSCDSRGFKWGQSNVIKEGSCRKWKSRMKVQRRVVMKYFIVGVLVLNGKKINKQPWK